MRPAARYAAGSRTWGSGGAETETATPVAAGQSIACAAISVAVVAVEVRRVKLRHADPRFNATVSRQCDRCGRRKAKGGLCWRCADSLARARREGASSRKRGVTERKR